MNHSQQELNDLYQSLKGQPSSDYDEARLTDGDLIQQLQIDVLMPDGTSKTVTYTRTRENLDAEWGLWEPGFSAAIAVD
jgi:restriction endonuclease